MLLKEDFNLRTGIINGKKMIFIDPETSETTFPYKDKIKEFGAHWIKPYKTWGWYAGKTPESSRIQYDKMIKPCLEFLMSVENQRQSGEQTDAGDGNQTAMARDVVAACDQLWAEIESEDWDEIAVNVPNTMTKEEIKDKLEGFKTELMRKLGSPEFLALMEPIIKFRRAAGYQVSLLNSIRIILQDPKATLVKSKTKWMDMNRTVKPDAIPIILLRPNGGSKYHNAEEKKAARADYLRRIGKTEDELTPGEKEVLKTELNKQVTNGDFFSWRTYLAYDIRFTEQVEGKEEIVTPDRPEYKWNEYDSDETARDEAYINAAIEVAKKYGLTIEYRDPKTMGGAKGFATNNGVIAFEEGAPMNRGMLNTVIHETAHELLHWSYLKRKDEDFKQFFLGTEQGRGLVEQQAELSAWIVMRILGYEGMDASLNYMGGWGMDAKTSCKVFDMVANVATKLSNDIERAAQGLNDEVNESRIMESVIRGIDVASLFGKRAVMLYRKGKQQLAAEGNPDDPDVQMENRRRVKATFFETYNRIKDVLK